MNDFSLLSRVGSIYISFLSRYTRARETKYLLRYEFTTFAKCSTVIGGGGGAAAVAVATA